MVDLKLDADEAELLRQVLREYLSDLRMEIADTDSLDYRDRLKDRKRLMRGIAERLERAAG